MRDSREMRRSAIEEQKTLHEEDGPVTSILMSRGVEVGPMFKSTAEASAYRAEEFPSKGTSGETWTTSTQAHTTAGCKMAESDELTTKPERSETEDKAEEECVAATVGHISEGTPLVLLQVNCRSIFNKILEFWNLIDTYTPDVVIGTESWLSEEINNAEVLGKTT